MLVWVIPSSLPCRVLLLFVFWCVLPDRPAWEIEEERLRAEQAQHGTYGYDDGDQSESDDMEDVTLLMGDDREAEMTQFGTTTEVGIHVSEGLSI